MTASEAIERIDEVLDSEYNYDETLGYQLTSDDFEWLETAKHALEKQIPAKPDYYADGYADGVLAYDYAKCPVCGKDYEYGINEWGCEYCSCGKKLDWSDME